MGGKVDKGNFVGRGSLVGDFRCGIYWDDWVAYADAEKEIQELTIYNFSEICFILKIDKLTLFPLTALPS